MSYEKGQRNQEKKDSAMLRMYPGKKEYYEERKDWAGL
jgi:hypothetical protein